MRTVSVKQAAQALGIGDRAVISRLHNGALKGVQKPNQYGVNEWRIYPNAEIKEKLKLGKEYDSAEIDFGPHEEAIDAETISAEGGEEVTPQNWIDSERQNMRMIAEEMMKPLLDTIRQQERQIEEQGRQLKLLPDFQRQAEEERQAAQLKALETEALNKQIAALKTEQEESEKAKQLVAELEQTLVQKQQEAEAEIERLKLEKEAQLKAVEDQIAALNQTVQELKKPWWKKILGSGSEPTST